MYSQYTPYANISNPSTSLSTLVDVSLTSLIGGQILQYNGISGKWENKTITGTGTVTSVAVATANGISGTVANPNTTPIITLTLGAITPSSVAATGTITGSNLSGTNTGDDKTSIIGILKGNGTTISAASAGTDYEVPLTFSTGLTRTTNTITVNTSQNISTLSNLTTNGFIKTSGGTGALSVDTNTYLTANQSITWTASNDVSGTASGTTSISPSLTVTGLRSVALPALTTSAGFLRYTGTGTNTWIFDTSTYLTGITLTNDVTGSGTSTISTTIANNAVTNAKFRPSAALSVVGNPTSLATNVTDIAGTSDQVLRVNSAGTSLGFGSIATNGISNQAVTYSKIQNLSTNNLLLGRATAGSGSVEEISLGSGLTLSGNQLSVIESNYPQVNTYNDLPITLGTPALGSIFVVLSASGVWLLNRKEAGLYRRTGNTGALTDWERLGNWSDIAKDSNFQLVNSANNTKLGKFDLSSISPNTLRTLSFPDASGTIALTSGNYALPTSSNSLAVNNSLYYSSDISDLAWKDPSGNIYRINQDPTNVITIKQTSDLNPYFNAGTNEYDIPSGATIKVLKSFVLPYPFRFVPGTSATLVAGNYFDVPNCVITYVGGGSPLRSLGFAGITIASVLFTSAGIPGQEMFAHDNGANPANWSKWVLISSTELTNWPSLGYIKGTNVIATTFFACFAMNQGLVMGNVAYPSFQQCTFAVTQNLSGTCFTFQDLILRSFTSLCNFALGATEKAIKINSAITTYKILVVTNEWDGNGQFFDSTGLNHTDPRVLCKFNPPQANSTNSIAVSNTGGLTTNPGTGTWALITMASPGLAGSLSRFSLVENTPGSGIFNVLQYTGIETISFTLTFQAAIQAGSSTTVRCGVGLNGANPTTATIGPTLDSGNKQLHVFSKQLTLSTGNTVRFYVSSVVGSANFTITDLAITGIGE